MLVAVAVFALFVFVGWCASYVAKNAEEKETDVRLNAYESQYKGLKGIMEAKGEEYQKEIAKIAEKLQKTEKLRKYFHDKYYKLLSEHQRKHGPRCIRCGRFTDSNDFLCPKCEDKK